MKTPDNTKIWTPSWKFLIITVLLGANIVLIRIIEALAKHSEILHELCMNSSNLPGVCQRLYNHHPTKQSITECKELRQELCVNNADSASGCLLCPNGWILHGDDCYYYSDVPERTWNQSRDQCEKMGADLPVIKNQEQKEFIQRDLRQQGWDTYWIGLHRDGDGWRWVDGEHYNSGLIQIETQSSGRCVSVTRSDYYQEDCRSTNRWICLKKAVRI
ncbi:killer cell lectin-like receptor subfamily B member 1B allele B isoform X1 [Bufo gargarizans]|uniref:killer cell lectin-like receptor subfamily B member 1B allele B isoform X1 n=1 Tax=Bufo gargarizans TaxID=30331 RepID=UPI001CF536E6|nr:killer cell lectin-like receptor subfamily B member 1B allele B isoform X1 [Bufo gargarizans]